MPTELRPQSASRIAAAFSSETTGTRLPPGDALQQAGPESIALTLILLAERGQWATLGAFLSHLDQLSETCGAVLMRALNVAPPGRAHKVLPYLLFHGASPELVQHVITLGALHHG